MYFCLYQLWVHREDWKCGHLWPFEKRRDRPCYMLGFLPFVLIPEYFSLWNLAKMSIKDSWKGQPVDCLQKWIGILIVDFKDQRAETFLSLPSVSLHQCLGTSSTGANCRTIGRSLYVAPRLLFCYTLEGELEVKVTDFSKQAWALKVLHAADSGIAVAVELWLQSWSRQAYHSSSYIADGWHPSQQKMCIIHGQTDPFPPETAGHATRAPAVLISTIPNW